MATSTMIIIYLHDILLHTEFVAAHGICCWSCMLAGWKLADVVTTVSS